MIRRTKLAVLAGVAGLGLALAWGAPAARADEPRHDRHGEMHDRDWRDHDRRDHDEDRRRWDRRREPPPVVVAPPAYYAPPPVVVAPPAGLNIVIPLNIR